MARVRDDMREVELVEVLDVPDGAGAASTAGADGSDGDGGEGPRPSRLAALSPVARARLRTASVAVVAGALVAATAGTVLADRREAARLRALADVPGVLAPLSGPVRALWTTDGWPTAEIEDVDGRLVTVLSAPGSTLDAVALDPRTGEAQWRTPIGPRVSAELPSQCVVPRAPSDAGPAPVEAADGTVLACVVADEVVTASDVGQAMFPYPVRSRLVVLDAVTGESLADRPVESPTSVAGVGTDLVLGTLDDRGHARVSRVDPRTGDERWVFTSPSPVPEDEYGLRHVWVESQHDVVVVNAGTVWALAADGDVLQELSGTAVPFGGSTRVMLGGRTLAHHRERDDGLTTELVDVASGRTTTLPGYVIEPHPDDGSLPDTVLVSSPESGGLVAHDARTGATRWTLVGHDSGQPFVLDGRIITLDGTELRALDGATGAVVWSTRVPGLTPAPMLTDGRLALVIAGSASGATLRAFDLRDGRSVWSTTLDDQPYLFSRGGRIFGYGSLGVVALGDDTPPG